MKTTATTPQEYIQHAPEERRPVLQKLRETILSNLPEGFQETMNYGMIGYVVPHELYPEGYHCDPKLPLPFINLASQKSHIALYHMGIYANEELFEWFFTEYKSRFNKKPGMGKSCIRFKNPDQIPFDLLEQLMKKITVTEWISTYEQALKR